jgi:hypothetical protein
MPRNRKEHPKPHGSAEKDAVYKAVQALQAVHPRNFFFLLFFGAMGLKVGREQKQALKLAADVRRFLTLTRNSKVFTEPFPQMTIDPASEVTAGPATNMMRFYSGLFSAIEDSIATLKSNCEKLLAALDDPAVVDLQTTVNEPEITMAVWAAGGPMVLGITEAPLSLSTADLMNLAVALEVDKPTEPAKARKWRWESKSRRTKIKKMTEFFANRVEPPEVTEYMELVESSWAKQPGAEVPPDLKDGHAEYMRVVVAKMAAMTEETRIRRAAAAKKSARQVEGDPPNEDSGGRHTRSGK